MTDDENTMIVDSQSFNNRRKSGTKRSRKRSARKSRGRKSNKSRGRKSRKSRGRKSRKSRGRKSRGRKSRKSRGRKSRVKRSRKRSARKTRKSSSRKSSRKSRGRKHGFSLVKKELPACNHTMQTKTSWVHCADGKEDPDANNKCSDNKAPVSCDGYSSSSM